MTKMVPMPKKRTLLASFLGLSASVLHGCVGSAWDASELSNGQVPAIRPSSAATGEADTPTETTGGDEGCEDSKEGCEIVVEGQDDDIWFFLFGCWNVVGRAIFPLCDRYDDRTVLVTSDDDTPSDADAVPDDGGGASQEPAETDDGGSGGDDPLDTVPDPTASAFLPLRTQGWIDDNSNELFDENESRNIYTYDAVGNITSHTYEYASNGIAWVWWYEYNTKGKLVVEWFDSNHNNIFDSNDRRYLYTYDNQDNKLTQTYEANGITWVRRNTYNQAGLLIFTYIDTDNSGAFDGNESREIYTYDGRGNSLTYGSEHATNGVNWTRRLTYDAHDRITSRWLDSDNSEEFDNNESRYVYTYDNHGNQLTEANETVADGVRWTRHRTFDDGNNMLTNWADSDNSGVFDNNESRYVYTYDNHGNQLTEAYETVNDGVRWTRYRTFDDGNNMLTNWGDSDNSGVFDNNESRYIYTYDNHGNQLTEAYETVADGVRWTRHYSYDSIELAENPCDANPCERPLDRFSFEDITGIEVLSTCHLGTLRDPNDVRDQVSTGVICVCSAEFQERYPKFDYDYDGFCSPL